MTFKHTMAIAAVFVTFGVGAAQAQGAPRGAAEGAAAGDAAAGPVGAAIGGVVGGVTGGIAGILGVDTRPRFHEYVVRQQHPSYYYDGDVRVGVVLPPAEIQYYEVPAEYGVRGYEYTIVDNHVVLVEPRTRRIVEIVD
jgi:Protein of unknown function (DUF1236)